MPSFETWFKILETDFNVFIPLELDQLMIEPYITMSKDQDVVEVFTTMTGCDRSGVYPERSWPSTGNGTGAGGTISGSCFPDVQMAFDFVVKTDKGPVEACKVGGYAGGAKCTITTAQCFKVFNVHYLAPALANNTD